MKQRSRFIGCRYHESVKRPFRYLRLTSVSRPARLTVAVIVLLTLIVLARTLGSAAFLWVALTGVPFLLGYARLETRGFLLIGAILVGSGIGILFEANLAWEGAYLTSVGAALATAEALEPTPGRLALLIGAILAGLGVALGVAAAGTTSVVSLAAVTLIAGAWYLRSVRTAPQGSTTVR